jgi:hypothetical protein
MINKIAYVRGSQDAWDTFVKVSNVPVMSFAKGAKGVPMPPPVAAAPAAPAMKPPVMGGAAAPPAAAPAAPAAAPAAGGGWKGVAKDIGVQMAVPLGMMGIQKMMEPSAPKDPNLVG